MTPFTIALAYLMDKGHKAFQRFGTFVASAILPPVVQAEEREPETSQWDAYQAHCKALREKARKNHAPVRHIDEQQQAVVNAALKGGA